MTDHSYDAKLEPKGDANTLLKLSGGVHNFLLHDLIMTVDGLHALTTFPKEAEVQIRWIPKEICTQHQPQAQASHGEQPYDESWRADLVDVEDRHPAIEASQEPVGELNGLFDLVAPLESAGELLGFWRGARALQHAHVVGLPDLKDLRKRSIGGMEQYVVLSRGVAMLAYLSHQEMDHVLLPALPVELADGKVAYRALMPMRLVLAGLSSACR